MPRPQCITNELIAKYDKRIDKDPLMDPAFSQNPIIREVCYAGQWLCDRLSELGCYTTNIGQLMYVAGRMCFGRKDPWVVHQEVLDGYFNGTFEFEVESADLN